MPIMNVSLPPDVAKIVQARIDDGIFSDPDEAVRVAVLQMDDVYQRKLAELKKALEPGVRALENGDYAEYSLEDLKKELDEEEASGE